MAADNRYRQSLTGRYYRGGAGNAAYWKISACCPDGGGGTYLKTNQLSRELMHPLKLLLLGDSLIEFYDWQARFPLHQIRNLGIAGETVEELLARTANIINRESPPDMVLIMIGTNNMVMEHFAFIPAYEKIVDTLAAAYPQSMLVINSLLPLQVPWLAETAIQRINDRLYGLAKAKCFQYLDVFQQFVDDQGQAKRSYFLGDGVHLSDEGYSAWSGAVEAFLVKHLMGT